MLILPFHRFLTLLLKPMVQLHQLIGLIGLVQKVPQHFTMKHHQVVLKGRGHQNQPLVLAQVQEFIELPLVVKLEVPIIRQDQGHLQLVLPELQLEFDQQQPLLAHPNSIHLMTKLQVLGEPLV